MEWYLMCWRKYAEFDGRSRRQEYWMFALFNFLAALVLGCLGVIGVAINRDYGGILFVPLGLYCLALFIPSIAVSVRRLHDTGKSGWLILLFVVLGVIPFVNLISGIVRLVFMCQDSDPGMNQYGLSPKYPDAAPGNVPGIAGFTTLTLNYQPPASPTAAIQPQPAACKSCGAPLSESSHFCASCGAHR
jgi:uncharacterized membrane protein YhaH (DUF805 family)